jgi:peptide-methionine (R)-S-oxide reductase
MMMRIFTLTMACLFLVFGVSTIAGAAEQGGQGYEIQKTDKEWRKTLNERQYRIMREHGTELPDTSPLLNEKRAGHYICAACGHELFASDAKFESGTGWPSYYQPASSTAIGTTTDYKIGYPRTEVHCARCGGHLGHVFKDGPEPTGLRYCINGAALNFTPTP